MALRKRRNLGTTLVELMIAVVFISIVVTALTGTLLSNSKNADRALYRAIALGLAKEAIENQRCTARFGSMATVVNQITNRSDMGVPVTFSTKLNVTEPTNGLAKLFAVNAKVTWTSPSGTADKLELELWVRDEDQ